MDHETALRTVIRLAQDIMDESRPNSSTYQSARSDRDMAQLALNNARSQMRA